jgi:hypothetical protein
MNFLFTNPNVAEPIRKVAGSRSWIALLALGTLVAGVQFAAAQRFVDVIDMPGTFDMYGGNGMSLNDNAGRLYIPSYSGSQVFVVDTLTNTVTGTLDAFFPKGTAYDPIGNRIYVTADYVGVMVFDAATETYLHSLPVYGWGIDVIPNTGRIYATAGSYLYVLDSDANPEDSVIDIIDLGAEAGAYYAYNLVVNPTTNMIYVADITGLVVAVDGDTHEVLATVPYNSTGFFPPIAIDVGLNQIYVTAWDEIVVIDGATNQIAQRIPLLGAGMGIAVNPATHRVYVNNDFYGAGGWHKKYDPKVNGHAFNHNDDAYHAYNTNGQTVPPVQLVVIDGVSGQIAGKHESRYCQGIFADPATGQVYSATRDSVTSENDVLIFQDVTPGN